MYGYDNAVAVTVIMVIISIVMLCVWIAMVVATLNTSRQTEATARAARDILATLQARYVVTAMPGLAGQPTVPDGQTIAAPLPTAVPAQPVAPGYYQPMATGYQPIAAPAPIDLAGLLRSSGGMTAAQIKEALAMVPSGDLQTAIKTLIASGQIERGQDGVYRAK